MEIGETYLQVLQPVLVFLLEDNKVSVCIAGEEYPKIKSEQGKEAEMCC